MANCGNSISVAPFATVIIGSALLVAFVAKAMPGEKEDAVTFLKTTLECPVPTESTKDNEGWYNVRKTSNEYLGNTVTFMLRESFTTTSGKIGGESYEEDHYTDITFRFSDISSVSVKGTKATVKCRQGQICMKVFYVTNPEKELEEIAMRKDPMDCFHDGMCRTEHTKHKASYRISTCSNEAASDIHDAITFLSGN